VNTLNAKSRKERVCSRHGVRRDCSCILRKEEVLRFRLVGCPNHPTPGVYFPAPFTRTAKKHAELVSKLCNCKNTKQGQKRPGSHTTTCAKKKMGSLRESLWPACFGERVCPDCLHFAMRGTEAVTRGLRSYMWEQEKCKCKQCEGGAGGEGAAAAAGADEEEEMEGGEEWDDATEATDIQAKTTTLCGHPCNCTADGKCGRKTLHCLQDEFGQKIIRNRTTMVPILDEGE